MPKQAPTRDLTGQMAKMAIGASGEGGVGGVVQQRRRRDEVEMEPATRQENFNKKGIGQGI